MRFHWGQQDIFVYFVDGRFKISFVSFVQLLSSVDWKSICFLNSLITLRSLMDMISITYLGEVINKDIGLCFSIDDSAPVMCC